MSYKHYAIFDDELDIKNLLKIYNEYYIMFVFGGTDYSQKPRKNYYEILITRNSKSKIYKKVFYDDKLTSNRTMLIGISEILKKISKYNKVIIITHIPLGFEQAITSEEGINFDYVYMVLNTIDHNDLQAIIYSLRNGSNKIKDVIRNPIKYALVPVL